MVFRSIKLFRNTKVDIGKDSPVKVLTIPFVKKTSEYNTGVELPADTIVMLVEIEVVTNVSGATIDVGTLETGSAGGNADGFVVARSCASAGHVAAAGSGAHTIGTFLIGSDQSGSNVRLPKIFLSADTRKISYTTSNHDVTGYIHIIYGEINKKR